MDLAHNALDNSLAVKNIITVAEIRELFERHVDRQLLGSYRLPVSDPETRVIIGLSGGADSSVLALFAAVYLAPHYPNIQYVFTDTKAEPESCYTTLDKIEEITGVRITRLIPEAGLFEKIEEYNGFLPNSRARWCTRELKIAPLIEYMKTIDPSHGYISLAGIRADEPDRDGISLQHSMENASAAYPFMDLGITKHTVFDILDRSIGIPGGYRWKSRSGCFSCFFLRNQEIIGTLENDPEGFAKTEAKEKLSEKDLARWDEIPLTLTDMGLGVAYPVPNFVDIRKPEVVPEKRPAAAKKHKVDTDQMSFLDEKPEGHKDLFAAFALYVDDRLGWFGGRDFTPGVYWQEFITISTSFTGLNSALGKYYDFKKTTPMPHYDFADMRIVVAQIRFPENAIDTLPPSKDSYTWKATTAYKQIRNLAKHCQLTLQYAQAQRDVDDAIALCKTTRNIDAQADAEEAKFAAALRLRRAPKPAGQLLWEGIYVPGVQNNGEVQLDLFGASDRAERKPAREGLEYDEVPMACIACSI